MLVVEAAAALAAVVLVEALPVEVALLWEGVVSMGLDSLVVLEVVLLLVGPVRVVLRVVLRGAVRVVIRHWNRRDRWDHQKEVDDGCLYCRLILVLSLGILVGRRSISVRLSS